MPSTMPDTAQTDLRSSAARECLAAALSHRFDPDLPLGVDPRTLRVMRKRWYRIGAATGRRLLRRGLDIAVAVTALITATPLFLAVACGIKLTDGGPVLFWQTRVGRFGRLFPCPKFRSMVVDAERALESLDHRNHHRGDSNVTFKMRRDPRVTWIGRIIRRLSIDELPQLWSVLRGDMTLVGPRPPIPREVSRYTLQDRRRLDVVPGLTCLWQVSGRGDIPFPEQVRLDVEYVESQSLAFDLQLLIRTIPAVLLGRGAY